MRHCHFQLKFHEMEAKKEKCKLRNKRKIEISGVSNRFYSDKRVASNSNKRKEEAWINVTKEYHNVFLDRPKENDDGSVIHLKRLWIWKNIK